MSLILSRLRLNVGQRDVRRDLGNPYDMHRTLVRAYADGPEAEVRPFLWRLEPGQEAQPPEILVQSESEPRWSQLPLGYLIEQEVRSWTPEEVLRQGRRLRFRLLANPTVCRVPPAPENQDAPITAARGNRKRLGLWKEEEQLAWMERQADKLGLASVEAVVSSSARLWCRRRGGVLTVAAALFEGQAVIADPSALATGIRQGVGHARLLGLGLVSVAPIRS